MSQKIKITLQTLSVILSIVATCGLLFPVFSSTSFAIMFAAVVFGIGAVVDFILLITRTGGKTFGALMMGSFLLNIFAIGMLITPFIQPQTMAIKGAIVVGIVDICAETFEWFKA